MDNWQIYGVAFTEEFASDLGDPRRTERLMKCGASIAENPASSFVEIFDDLAEREAFYRLVRNDHVDFAGILSAHSERTVSRCAGYDEVLVLHDTTEFSFPCVDGLMRDRLHGFSKNRQGFNGHISLAATADGLRLPLGVANFRGYVPHKTEPEVAEYWAEQFGKLVNLNDRWFDSILATEKLLTGTSVIHVADREADVFSLLGLMDQHGFRYVIRAKQDRKARKADSDVIETLNTVVAQAEFVAQRKITLSARPIANRPPEARERHPPRARREAVLDFRFTRVTLEPPVDPGTSTANNQPETYRPLQVTAIEAIELNPPEGEIAVRWLIITSEDIVDSEHMMRVVDMYRTRWLIEEFNKAIKTGCAYQKRQMESATTLLTTLAILLPIAWRLLVLRHLERNSPDIPAAAVLSDVELKVLRAALKKKRKKPLPRSPSVSDVYLSIAQLGGHIPQNGPPGWQVIGRGLEKLLTLVDGYRLMLEEDL